MFKDCKSGPNTDIEIVIHFSKHNTQSYDMVQFGVGIPKFKIKKKIGPDMLLDEVDNNQ